LSQPRGSCILRLAAFFLIKILRTVSSTVTVDLASFRHVLDLVKNSKSTGHFVLAPTHRSLFDFVLLSYIFFSLPELQVEIPFIVAANDFERLSVIGWFARMLGAFYIRRGIGFEDCDLLSRLRVVKEVTSGNDYVCFEVFLEGKRSRRH
jgi:glycerol-3-phosphate O-acyltransferase